MLVILGLVILAAAVVAGVAGVLTNGGHAHAVTHFAVFGYHVTGSTGTLFLYGIVVGALALAGLSVLAAGVGRSSRRGLAARASLAQSRRETAAVSQHRDELIRQRDTTRAYDELIRQRDTTRAYTVLDEQRNYTASTLGDGEGSPRADRDPGRRDPGRAWPPADPPGTLPGQAANAPAAQTPATAPAPAE